MGRNRKPGAREALIKGSLKEFTERGYLGATMRNIAMNADMTVGNIYSYFKGKDALFTFLVSGVYTELEKFIDEAGTVISGKISLDSDELDTALTKFASYIKDNRENIIVLLNASVGTRYETSKQKLSQKVGKQILNLVKSFTKQANKKTMNNKDFVITIMSDSMVEAYVQIIQRTKTENDCKNAIFEMLTFFFNGIKALFK